MVSIVVSFYVLKDNILQKSLGLAVVNVQTAYVQKYP